MVIGVKQMIQGIFAGIITLFVLIGILAVSYSIVLRIGCSKNDEAFYILLVANEKSRNVAGQLYSTQLYVQTFCSTAHGKLVAVDNGMSEHERTLCRDLARESRDILFVQPQDLAQLLTAKQFQD